LFTAIDARARRAGAASLVAFPTRLLTYPTALFLALLGFLCGPLALWFLGLAMRRWWLLRVLRRPLLWLPRLGLPRWCLRGSPGLALRLWRLLLTLRRLLLWLPRLRLGCRPSLGGRRLGGGGPLHVSAALLLGLPALGWRGALLRGRRRSALLRRRRHGDGPLNVSTSRL
jgi:hypothetical protein